MAFIARLTKASVNQLFGVVIMYNPNPSGFFWREGGPTIILVKIAGAFNGKEVVDSVEGDKRNAEAGEEGCIVKLEEGVRGISHTTSTDNKASDGGRPTSYPTRNNTPVETVAEPVV